jgi:hypothetical protein
VIVFLHINHCFIYSKGPNSAQLNSGKIHLFPIPLTAVKANREDFYISSGLRLTTVIELMSLSKPSASRCRCELFSEFPVSSPELILTFYYYESTSENFSLVENNCGVLGERGSRIKLSW